MDRLVEFCSLSKVYFVYLECNPDHKVRSWLERMDLSGESAGGVASIERIRQEPTAAGMALMLSLESLTIKSL